MPRLYSLLAALAFAAALALPATAQVAATVTCSAPDGQPTGHIDWPAANPVWRFDFLRPASSTGSDGSGIELRNVTYNGNVVFKRAHAPILNVQYEPGGGCSCFRDWQYSENRFQADGVRPGQSCFAESTPGFVRTNCEVNQESGGTQGADIGSFTGVAVEDFGDELVLTSNMDAGWYRYRMKWHLYADGRIWPEYSFGNANATCTGASRRHHVYWRFDFDVDGTAANDIVQEINPTTGATTTFTTEQQRTWGTATDGVYWTVTDAASSRGYTVEPSLADRLLAVDSFSKLDAAVLRYSATQIDDGAAGGCAISPPALGLNGESVDGQDVVFWYRSGSFKLGGSDYECDIVGPSLRPLGVTVANEPGPAELPAGFELQAAYPNPFNPTTTVRFRVAEAQQLRIEVLDALGRVVQTPFAGYAEANRYESVRVESSGTTRIALLK